MRKLFISYLSGLGNDVGGNYIKDIEDDYEVKGIEEIDELQKEIAKKNKVMNVIIMNIIELPIKSSNTKEKR